MATATAAINQRLEGQSAAPVSWENFQRDYLSREDEFKYEWLNGIIEKTPRSMDKSQIYIFNNLIKFLFSLQRKLNIDGLLVSELDTIFAKNHRRPDIAFLTERQIEDGRLGKNVVPKFVIEVISRNDQINRVHQKMEDYRLAKVEIVWHIFPELKEIHVYRGRNMVIHQGNDLCSAKPVIEGFEIAVNDVFGSVLKNKPQK